MKLNQPIFHPIQKVKIQEAQKQIRWYEAHPEKRRPLKLPHQFIPGLFFCEWLPRETVEEQYIQQKVYECYPFCCFNHLIGLPTIKYEDENGLPQGESEPIPLWYYEKNILEKYESNNFYALNKCRGAGASELFIRYFLFKALTTPLQDRKFLIIAGINQDSAQALMYRMKVLADLLPFMYRYVPHSDSPAVMIFKRGMVLALPAKASALRLLENVGDILIDESAFWNLIDDEVVLTAAEPHVFKSNAHVAAVSTPNGQRGFFWTRIFNPDVNTKYEKHVLNWREVIDVKIPIIDKKAVLKMQTEDPVTYEQELNNQFLLSSEAVFGKFDLEKDYEPSGLAELLRKARQESGDDMSEGDTFF